MASMLVDGLLKTIAMLHPEYASAINFFFAHESEFEKLAPIADAAVREGPGAFAAAEEHAPELAKAIRSLVDSVAGTASTPEEAYATLARNREIVTQHLTGISKPEQNDAQLDRPTATGN